MAKADLTAARLRELLSYDPTSGHFHWLVNRRAKAKAGDLAGTAHDSGYWLICIDGRDYRAHRLAWLYVHGQMPNGMLDHINRDKRDNRIENLRECVSYINQRNTGLFSTNTSGTKGVHWKASDSRWHASIVDRGTRYHLGDYATLPEAAAARQAAERVLFAQT
jgi:hypothetical protein